MVSLRERGPPCANRLNPPTRNFHETSRLVIGCRVSVGGQWVGGHFIQRTVRPSKFEVRDDWSGAERGCVDRLVGRMWQLSIDGRAAGRRCQRAWRGRSTAAVAVHSSAGRGRPVRRRRFRRPCDGVLVLGADLNDLQRRSSFGRSSSTAMGRPGRFRRRRVDGRRRIVQGIHRQVLVVVPSDQRRPRNSLRPLRCSGPAGPGGRQREW